LKEGDETDRDLSQAKYLTETVLARGWPVLNCKCCNCDGGEMPRLRWWWRI